MPPSDQLQCRLTFSDSALAHDQNSLTIDIHKHPMDRDTWCQFFIQRTDHGSRKICGCPFGTKHRDLMADGDLQKVIIRLKSAAEDHAWNVKAEQLFICRDLALCRHLLQIRKLYHSDDLYTSCGKMLKISV